MSTLAAVAPPFVAMAHRIVWCVAATTGAGQRARTRVLHPVWEWDGTDLTGWIATSPQSPKAADLRRVPAMSLTYWSPDHDTCTADCDARWEVADDAREAGWRRFKDAPEPVGYDPAIIPGWDAPSSPSFGMLRLHPRRLRVMPGSVLMAGRGERLSWRR